MSDFKNELEQEVEFINDLISRYLPDETGLDKKIREAMNYSVNAGGKRVRPMLMLEVYKLCGGDDCQVVYPFMAALECIHSYSLVHDDLPAMDNDDYRRGRLTTHKVFGEDFGILAGDGLLNLAYEIMAEALISGEGDMTAKAKAMEVIARKAGIKGMVGGQAVDVELTGKALSDEQLDFIFRLKTGALIEAAFLAGAYLAVMTVRLSIHLWLLWNVFIHILLYMMIFRQWITMITEEEDLQHIKYLVKISEYLQETDFLIWHMRLWLKHLYQVKEI